MAAKRNVGIDSLRYHVCLSVARAHPRDSGCAVLAQVGSLARPPVPPVIVGIPAVREEWREVGNGLVVEPDKLADLRFLAGFKHCEVFGLVFGHRTWV